MCLEDGNRFQCTNDDTCLKKYNHTSNGWSDGYYVDWNSKYSLHNWIEQFDLRCASPFTLGFFAQFFFVGHILGTILLAKFGDKEGRIYTLRYALILSATLYFALLFISQDINLHYYLFFGLGFLGNLRNNVSYIYGQEIVHNRHSKIIGTFFNASDSLSMIFMALFYQYISRHWLPPQIICLILTALSCGLAWILPESPKFLIQRNKFH